MTAYWGRRATALLSFLLSLSLAQVALVCTLSPDPALYFTCFFALNKASDSFTPRPRPVPTVPRSQWKADYIGLMNVPTQKDSIAVYLASYTNEGYPTKISATNFGSYGIPDALTSVYLPDQDLFIYLANDPYDSKCYFNTLRPSDGSFISSVVMTKQCPDNLQYDSTLKQLFATSTKYGQGAHSFFFKISLKGEISAVVSLAEVVGFSMGSYDSHNHVWYVLLNIGSGTQYALATIDTRAMKLVSQVKLQDDPQMIFWEPTEGVMYSIVNGVNDNAATVTTIDPKTGKRLKIITAFKLQSAYTDLGAVAVLDSTSQTLAGVFISVDRYNDLIPWWVSINLTNGSATVISYPYDAPSCLNLAPA